MEILNNYSGLISLIAAVAAIGAVIVPVIIFKKQRKYDEEAERNRIKNERQDVQDELASLRSHSPFPMSENERARYSRSAYLDKRLERLNRK